MKFRLIILLIVSGFSTLYSQTNTNINDLLIKLEVEKNDSTKSEILCQIAWSYRDYKPDSTIYYSEKALILAKKNKNINQEIQARAFYGVGCRNIGEYEKALVLFNQNLKIAKEHNLKNRIAYSLLNSGNINLMQNNYLAAIDKILEAIKIGTQIKDTTIIGYAYINLARTYQESEDYKKELEAHHKALDIRKTQNNTHNIAVSEHEIGECYYRLNEPDKALYYFNLAQEKFEADNSPTSLGLISQGIGLVYFKKKQYNKAEKYFNKALIYFKETIYIAGTAETHKFMCELFFEQKKYNKALEHAIIALEISREIEIPKYSMTAAKYISDIYKIKGNTEKAYNYFIIYDSFKTKTEKSKYIREFTKITMEFEYKKEKEKKDLIMLKRLSEEKKEIEKQRIIKNSFIIGFILILAFSIMLFLNLKTIKTKNYSLIKQNIEIKEHKEEISLQSEILADANNEIIITSENLRKQNQLLETTNKNITLLNKIGQEITACLYTKDIIEATYESLSQLVDTTVFSIGIYNKRNQRLDFQSSKENGDELPFHFLKLKSKDSLAITCLLKQQSILIRNLKQDYNKYLNQFPPLTLRNTTTSIIYIPLTINNNQIGVLTVQSFRKNAYTKTHLEIIQNIGINTAIALENANSYKIIKRKNDEINGAIKYARKLQYSFLPLKEDIDMSLNNYIIYKPKDIISGDFYWHKVIRKKNKLITFIAVADCTGHGISGALMSGIGIGILNEIVPKKMETDEILEYLNFEVKNVLKQEQTKNNDGMDICLCKIEQNNNGETKLCFTGAKRPLIHYNSNTKEINTIKGNLKTIGSNYVQEQKFTKTQIILSKNDIIWLTSDGYSDQNNKFRKKIGTLGLLKILTEVATKPFKKQEQIIQTRLNQHMLDVEQRDDITIIGIKF